MLTLKNEEKSPVLKRLNHLFSPPPLHTVTEQQLVGLLHCKTLERSKFSLKAHAPQQLFLPLLPRLLCLSSNTVLTSAEQGFAERNTTETDKRFQHLQQGCNR